MWRVYFRRLGGHERYMDAEGSWPALAIRETCERFRAEPGGMRGWWVDRWQPLVAWVTATPGGVRADADGIKGPPLRRRVYVRWRRFVNALQQLQHREETA